MTTLYHVRDGGRLSSETLACARCHQRIVSSDEWTDHVTCLAMLNAFADQEPCPRCRCCELEAEQCPDCAGEGGFDLYEDDPIAYELGEWADCELCQGLGFLVECTGRCGETGQHQRQEAS